MTRIWLWMLPKRKVCFYQKSWDNSMPKTQDTGGYLLPINAACTLVQANTGELIKDGKDLMAAIGKFQCTLHQLMQFYENPMPCLCAQVVHLACWIYVILGSFAIQSCSGNHSSIWLPILVRNLHQ